MIKCLVTKSGWSMSEKCPILSIKANNSGRKLSDSELKIVGSRGYFRNLLHSATEKIDFSIFSLENIGYHIKFNGLVCRIYKAQTEVH